MARFGWRRKSRTSFRWRNPPIRARRGARSGSQGRQGIGWDQDSPHCCSAGSAEERSSSVNEISVQHSLNAVWCSGIFSPNFQLQGEKGVGDLDLIWCHKNYFLSCASSAIYHKRVKDEKGNVMRVDNWAQNQKFYSTCISFSFIPISEFLSWKIFT